MESVILKRPHPVTPHELRVGLPRATELHEQARTIGSASEEAIRTVGFDVIPAPSSALPKHHRIVHPEGGAGFSEANLARFAEVFVNTTGHGA